MSDHRFIKLVRDHVGNKDDEVVYARFVGTQEEFHKALRGKLREEVDEYYDDPSLSELIDVFEAIWALGAFHKITMRELGKLAEERRLERGSFLNRMAMWIRRP